MDIKSIGIKIRDQRERLGISQMHLANNVGVTLSYISNIESGNKLPKVKILIDICNELELSLDYIFTNELKMDLENMFKDENLIELRAILKKLGDETLIREYMYYAKNLANSMKEFNKLND